MPQQAPTNGKSLKQLFMATQPNTPPPEPAPPLSTPPEPGEVQTTPMPMTLCR